MQVVDGVEIDYSSNELGAVLLGVLKGNGNYIERFLSGYFFAEVSWASALRPLVQASLSKRIFRHYLGFATQQRLEWEKGGCTSAKKLLYVLRTTLTGAHALATGEVVTDVTRLLGSFGLSDAMELVEQKRRGEKSELPAELSKAWLARVPEVFQALENAHAKSALPEEPPNAEALEKWLVARRLEELAR
jgi:predicted nucleotidyltransferase